MASSNSTAHLGLNQWSGNDSPKMADFNGDNSKIDAAVGAHTADAAAHVTAAERQLWNSAAPLFGSYVGDGAETHALDIGFPPSFGMVYAVGKNILGTQGGTGNMLVHSAFISKNGCSEGATIAGNVVTLLNLDFVVNNRLALLNLTGVNYCYLFFP